MTISRIAVCCCFLLVFSIRWADATFSFPGFSSSSGSGKPLMAALGSSIQQYFALPMARIMSGVGSDSAPASSSHSPGYLLPATATVGIGTILHGNSHPPLVKGVPYGPARPVSPDRGMMRPRPNFHRMPMPPRGASYSKYPPKNSYYGATKIKPQHINSLQHNIQEKEINRPVPQEQHYYQQQQKEHNYYHAGTYEIPNNYNKGNEYLVSSTQINSPASDDYTRGEILHSTYSTGNNNEEQSASNRAPVIVYQGVRPPVRFYQEPRPSPASTHNNAISSMNINTNNNNNNGVPIATSTYERSDNQLLDYSRPDPVFSSLQNSDWKPINAPVGAVPARGYSITPPDLSRRSESSKQVSLPLPQPDITSLSNKETINPVYTGSVDRSSHDPADNVEPSEEVVSAVVFVKQ